MDEEPELKDFSQNNLIEISAGVSRKLKAIAVSIYRPPSGNEEIFLDTIDRLLLPVKSSASLKDLDPKRIRIHSQAKLIGLKAKLEKEDWSRITAECNHSGFFGIFHLAS
ncbi:hypothetical protein HHI36_000630 [Cryptolaemus montrouzieri]|uniref:Uncharacterized protein n=1 Tax=Cryptolaemus montrouzieri TaxID=559131 RepID=A0ABD2P577_9CUCU